jgi:3-hydroxy-9,10-secoandrosta-1,3,5(10)-triene-9,17-dione monooxygenase reductase component
MTSRVATKPAVSHDQALSPLELRKAFGSFTTGVTVVTAVSPDGSPIGITANSVTSVSLDPPLLLWCLGNRSSGLAAFGQSAPFAVHILSERQADIASHFAKSGRPKFDVDMAWQANPQPPRIADVVTRIDCVVDALHPGGDHTIIVGRVTGVEMHALPPLAFHASRFGRFHKSPTGGSFESWGSLEDGWM